MKRIIAPCLTLIAIAVVLIALAGCGQDTNEIRFFAMDGKTQIGKTQQVSAGGTFTVETAPTVEGYTFLGWSYAGDLYDFDAAGAKTASGDMTFVAMYSEDPCEISFYDGDRLLATAAVPAGQRVPATYIPDARKVGYYFIGWSRAGETTLYDLNQRTTSDVTLVAQYQRTGWVVTFLDEDGETILAQVEAQTGETVYYTGKPLEKMVDGKRYELVSFGEIAPVTEDVTYTAVWRLATAVQETGGDSYDADRF